MQENIYIPKCRRELNNIPNKNDSINLILGYQPREVQFAIVEQNPTLLNITLFAENNNAERLEATFNNGLNGLQDLDSDDRDKFLEDKLDDLLGKNKYFNRLINSYLKKSFT